MTGTTQKPRRNWKQRFLTSLLWWWIGLTWYTLSIGPMYWTWHRAALIDEPSYIELFYRPLLTLCQIPYFGDLVNSYIDLWVTYDVSDWHPPALK
jgi:hypothetical protein